MIIQKLIKAFVASPADTKEERSIFVDVVNELNTTWADFLGVRIDIVKWETHSWPAKNSDAQAAINEQIADDYDVFIGIVKKSLGTLTPRADSGTVEEFERAYDRNVKTGMPEIMFYLHSDYRSNVKISNFADRLSTLGIYYWPYENEKCIASACRIHLSRLIQRLAQTQQSIQSNGRRFPVPDKLQLQSGLNHLQHFLSEADAKFKAYNCYANNLRAVLDNVGCTFREATQKLEQLNQTGFQQEPEAMIKIMLELSNALCKYANQIN